MNIVLSRDRSAYFDCSLGRLAAMGRGRAPTLSSESLDWRGFALEEHHLTQLDPRETIWMKHMVSVALSDMPGFERRDGATFVPAPMRAGQVIIVPNGAHTSNRSSEPVDLVCVTFEPSFLAIACGQMVNTEDLELPERYGVDDPLISGLCLALRKEVELGGPSGKVYSESLASSLAVHLVARFAKLKREATPAPDGGLSRRAVKQVTELIESRLNGEISLQDLAASVGLSPFHFARLFKRTFGLPPHQFVVRRRLDRAKRLLLQGDLPLAQVAREVGFCDQSHLALHLKRDCGFTPREFVHHFRRN